MLPLILITFNYLIENNKQIKLFNYLAFTNIVIILFARIIIANEGVIPVKLSFHGNEEWTLKVKELTKNSDKLFINSFQNASIYWFYTKEKTHYQNNYLGRKNQYGFIPDNNQFTTDSIAYITRISKNYSEIKMKSSGKDSIFISYIDNYKSFFKIEIEFIDSEQIIFSKSPRASYRVLVKNPYDFNINVNDLEIDIVFQNKKANEKYSIPAKANVSVINSSSQEIIYLEFDGSLIDKIHEYPTVGIGIRTSQKMDLVKVSSINNYKIAD